MRRSIYGVLLALFTTGAVPASAASLIVNGSFESSSVDPGLYCSAHTTGDTSITGWEVTAFEIHYCDVGYWPASDGTRSIDLDGDSSEGGMRQSFATVAGQTYTVSFDMAGNNYGLPVIKPMQVSADGQSAVFQFDTTGTTYAAFGWTTMTWSFVADDGSATLEFLSLTPTTGYIPSYGAVIDNVVVTPEPALLALLLGGLGGIAGLRQRHPRSA